MKVYSGESLLHQSRTVRPAGYLLLIAIMLSVTLVPLVRATPSQQTPSTKVERN
jgi:hypothetical protein